jgi:hypothetical protein
MEHQTLESRDRFECWLMEMDDAIQTFIDQLPPDIATRMDYAPESLPPLEAWLLSRFAEVDAAVAPEAAAVVDGAARYLGEVFRKLLGGRWDIELEDKKNAFFRLPQLKGLPQQSAQICPHTLVTASLHRRTGQFLKTILDNNRSIAANVK